MKQKLAAFINHAYTDWTVVFLILASIFLLIAEAVLPVTDPAYPWVDGMGWAITLVFAVELTIRYGVESKKRRFWSRYWIDVLAVLPVLRPFRVLRVLRIFRALRAGALLIRRVSFLGSILREGSGAYFAILGVLVVLVLCSAIALKFVEGRGGDGDEFGSLEGAAWWSLLSIVAGEPIGQTPTTRVGRVITLVVMLGGLTIFAMLIGVVTAVMVDKVRTRMEANPMDLDELQDHIVIGGWSRAAPLIIEEFQSDPATANTPIVVIAEFDETPRLAASAINRALIFFLHEDYTRIETLEKANIRKARIAVLVADKSRPRSDQDRDARTVLAALSIEKLNSRIFTCVELLNRDNEAHLKMAGVEEVVVADEYAGSIMASASRNEGIVDMLNELLTTKYGNQFNKMAPTPDLVGRPVREVHGRLKEEHDAVLVSIETANTANGPPGRTGRRYVVNPPNDYVVQADDRLLTISRGENER